MLSSWGVAFEAVDVQAEPGRRADLERLGIPRVPAVVVGRRSVHGWNPGAVAALVGVEPAGLQRLGPAELARRLDRILDLAQRAIRQIPVERLAMTTPGRERPIRQLAYHVFRLSLAFRDAMAEGRFPEAWLDEPAPGYLRDGAAIAAYGEAVRAALRAWFRRADAWDRGVETYYGSQPGPDLLERTVWHAAQHVRQLHALLRAMDLEPEAPLTEADTVGLPLPAALW